MLDEFQKNGFIIKTEFFDKKMIGELRDITQDFDYSVVRPNDIVFDDNVNTPNSVQTPKFWTGVNYYNARFNVIFNSRVLDLVRNLLGQEVYFSKPLEYHDKIPHYGTESPPHQDNFYFCLDPPDAVTAYIPLEKHSKENGCLQFVPGSHLGGVLPHKNSLTKGFSGYVEGFEGKPVYAELNPGDLAIHHCNTIHLADANRSGNHRRSLAARIVGEKAQKSPMMVAQYTEFRRKNRQV